jgi:hypothetical protein
MCLIYGRAWGNSRRAAVCRSLVRRIYYRRHSQDIDVEKPQGSFGNIARLVLAKTAGVYADDQHVGRGSPSPRLR